jgi:hypothetical protein
MGEENKSPASSALARMQALKQKRAALEEVASPQRSFTQGAVVAPQTAPQKALDIRNNPINKIMTDDKQSSKEKIRLVAEYLSAENEDYTTARARFAEFETYFASVQGEGTQLYKDGIRKLIEEVKGALKPAVEKIVRDITVVQEGAAELRRLIEIMHEAHVNNKTVDQVREALELNDRIAGQIDSLTSNLAELQSDLPNKEAEKTAATDAKTESEKFWRKLMRLGVTDTLADQRLADAIRELENAKAEITRTQQALKDKALERNTALESGPLLILRTMDAKGATETGFTAKIVETAEHALGLIQGTQDSVAVLFSNLLSRRDEAAHISSNIAVEKVREAILQGALERAAEASHTRSEEVKGRLAAKDTELAAATDDVERATLNADRVEIAETEKSALRYEEAVKRTLGSFAVVAANTVNAESDAVRLAGLLQSTENMLSQIHTEALPEATRALLLSLEEGMAVRDAGLTQDVAKLIDQGRKIGREGFTKLRETQKEMRGAELEHMEELMKLLGQATDDVVTEAELMTAHGSKRGGLAQRLTEAKNGLQAVLEEYEDLSAAAAGAHGGTADVVLSGVDGKTTPERPPAPTNGGSGVKESARFDAA